MSYPDYGIFEESVYAVGMPIYIKTFEYGAPSPPTPPVTPLYMRRIKPERFPGEYKKIRSEKFAEGVSDKDLENVKARGKTKRSVYVLEHSPHIDPR